MPTLARRVYTPCGSGYLNGLGEHVANVGYEIWTKTWPSRSIWTIRPDGTGVRKVTDAGPTTRVYSASFSPDGTAITLGMTGIDDQADVYTIGIDGTGLTPMTRTSEWDSAPDWGPAP